MPRPSVTSPRIKPPFGAGKLEMQRFNPFLNRQEKLGPAAPEMGIGTMPRSGIGGYRYDAQRDETELLWKCLVCGELKPRNGWVLAVCPACGALKSQFVLVVED